MVMLPFVIGQASYRLDTQKPLLSPTRLHVMGSHRKAHNFTACSPSIPDAPFLAVLDAFRTVASSVALQGSVVGGVEDMIADDTARMFGPL